MPFFKKKLRLEKASVFSRLLIIQSIISEMQMWKVRRDKDQLGFRDVSPVHLHADCQQPRFRFLDSKSLVCTYLASIPLFASKGSICLITELKWVSNSQTPQLLTIFKHTSHFHFRRKRKETLTFGRDQKIHFETGNLVTGFEGKAYRRQVWRFLALKLLIIFFKS